ncbi:MAG: hypothetical protein CMJ19_11950 [Phycisphaeraceae bacterium]|nr:hypothetical protein [Phycisphaeraceae bacterium]|tara:strand:- start:322 stop:501 length:180 start_codon:yes stop_codon:yes gene_type:complete
MSQMTGSLDIHKHLLNSTLMFYLEYLLFVWSIFSYQIVGAKSLITLLLELDFDQVIDEV